MERVWWLGLDVHELVTRIIENDPRFADTQACEILYDQFNELQAVFDRARLSDSVIMAARKVTAPSL